MALAQLEDRGLPFPSGEQDVQRTAFSLDVLGRYICSTFNEATANPDFDIVVIGSGMYGAYAAAKLYNESGLNGRPPLRILVLEAGPFLVHEHAQNIPDLGLSNPFRPVLNPYDPEAHRTRNLVWGMGWRGNTGFPGTAYCVGGKSIFWGGWCPRLREADLAQWPSEVATYLSSPPPSDNLPNRQSAPGRASVYEAVEYEIGVRPADDFVFDPVSGDTAGGDRLGLNRALDARLRDALATLRGGAGTALGDPEPPPIAVQTQSFVSGVFSPDKYSSLTHLIAARRAEASRPDGVARFFLVPNTHVCQLEIGHTDRDGTVTANQRVTSIRLITSGREQRLFLGPDTQIVLALGCIESTRLALESFPTKARRSTQDEIMGRNLMAHLRFDFPFTIDRSRFAKWVKKVTGKTLEDELQTASFHLQGDSSAGRFHLQVYATGQDASTSSEEGLLYRMIPNPEIAQRLSAMQSHDKVRMIFRACGEMKGDRALPVGAPGTHWIDLAGQIDRDQTFNHARAFVHYDDVSQAPIWQEMRKACEALATQLGADSLPQEDRHEVGSSWHDSGTLFMGEDPEHSVTDSAGRFHHVLNVSCVDQAVFPTVGSANPVLTGLCLARKTAEALVDRCISQIAPKGRSGMEEDEADFTDLIEGTDAVGPLSRLWTANNVRHVSARPALIANGTILEVHGDAGLGILFYDDPTPFTDFDLRLQWKAFCDPVSGEGNANSGIFLRIPRPDEELGDDFYRTVAEVQIDDMGYDAANRQFGSPLHRTGALYGHLPARIQASKRPSREGSDGYWNDYRLLVTGRDLLVELNGRVVSRGQIPASLSESGRIGLQYHSGKVQFRAIRIKRL